MVIGRVEHRLLHRGRNIRAELQTRAIDRRGIEPGVSIALRGVTPEFILAFRLVRRRERTEKPPDLVVIVPNDGAAREEVCRDSQRPDVWGGDANADWFGSLGRVPGARPR